METLMQVNYCKNKLSFKFLSLAMSKSNVDWSEPCQVPPCIWRGAQFSFHTSCFFPSSRKSSAHWDEDIQNVFSFFSSLQWHFVAMTQQTLFLSQTASQNSTWPTGPFRNRQTVSPCFCTFQHCDCWEEDLKQCKSRRPVQ